MIKNSETIGSMLSRIRPGAYSDLDPEICAASREKLIAFAELADRIERARKHRPEASCLVSGLYRRRAV